MNMLLKYPFNLFVFYRFCSCFRLEMSHEYLVVVILGSPRSRASFSPFFLDNLAYTYVSSQFQFIFPSYGLGNSYTATNGELKNFQCLSMNKKSLM